MLEILNIKLIIGCANSDGLIGFGYSHDGYWNDNYKAKGSRTLLECADTCLQDCVAIIFAIIFDDNFCLHYSYKADISSANVEFSSDYKAYIKCPGNNR